MTGQPETVAGNAVVDLLLGQGHHFEERRFNGWNVEVCKKDGESWPCTFRRQVDRIAAAARAEAFAEIRRGVEGLATQQINWYDAEGQHEEHADAVRLYQVTALLPSVPPEEK